MTLGQLLEVISNDTYVQLNRGEPILVEMLLKDYNYKNFYAHREIKNKVKGRVYFDSDRVEHTCLWINTK